MRLASVPYAGRLVARVPANERVVRAILRQVGLGRALDTGRFSQEAIDYYVALLRETDTMSNELDVGARVISPRHGLRDCMLLSDATLASITTPVLFLWGEDDPLAGAAIARSFAARFPDATLEIVPQAGHAVWIDEPDAVAARTRAFLAGWSD
jgi:pimeloyl-ACP methyl ester carboxylesterase